MNRTVEVDRPAPAGAADHRSPPRRVLVVDDNRDAADVMTMLLRMQGHEARAVYDGEGALHAAPVLQPHVVLLDLALPGIDGYEVARRLRGPLGLGACLLVALTGLGRDEDRRRCAEAGFDHFLLKPCDLHQLSALLAMESRPALGPNAV